MARNVPLAWRSLAIFSVASAHAVDSLLQNGWYIENIAEKGLGYLLFVVEAASSAMDLVGFYSPEIADSRVIMVVLRSGGDNVHQRLIVLPLPEGGRLDTEAIQTTIAKEHPGWTPVLSTRLDATNSLTLIDK
jgi:hypothetical protein